MKIKNYIFFIILLLCSQLAFGQQVQSPDDQLIKLQFKFKGEWMPDRDPAEIGPENYQVLQNLSYRGAGLHPVGVLGYKKVNTTALSTHKKIRSGIQLETEYDKESYVFVHTKNDSGEGKVYQLQASIPNQGNFETTELHTDATGAGLGRWSVGPQGSIAYSNGKESMIWAGEETRVSYLYTISDASYSFPINYTEQANNTLDTLGNLVPIGVQKFWIVFSSRPIEAVNYTIKTANTTASTTTVKVFNGTSFVAVSNLTDGTASGGVSLAQDGSFSFDSTVGTAKPFHLEGKYLYAYMFEISAGSAEISHITVNAPWQPIGDVWDGVLRTATQFQVFNGTKYSNYTNDVAVVSSTDYHMGAILDALPTSGYIIVMFEEPTAGIRFEMLAGFVNTNAATATVEYWGGTSGWTTVGSSLRDETLDAGGTKTLSQTGVISWSPPDPSLEHKKTEFGREGYAYKISFSATLSGTAGGDDDIVIDLVNGIPAQLQIKPFAFPSTYKNRLLLCGYTEGKQGNRVDFSMANTPDAFNGLDSSADGLDSLYFGDVKPLTCGKELFNRYGSTIRTTWVAFKKSSFYQLTGDSPEDFKIKPVSDRIGCPAPLTLVAIEGYPLYQDLSRNVVAWLSHQGPYIFDGSTPIKIHGVNKYFDPSESVCINFEAIENARAWFDATYRELNFLIPSGPGQITNNVWLVCDVEKKKWFEKATGIAEMPQCGFPVVDADGNQYIYAGIDTGYLMRLENGASWDGAGITYKLITGDFWPTNNIWDQTLIRSVKVIAQRIDEAHTLDVLYFGDTAQEEGTSVTWNDTDYVEWVDTDYVEWVTPSLLSMELETGSGILRLTRDTIGTNLKGWAHCFGFQVTTTSTERAFTPIGWGIRYQFLRDDL